MSTQWILPSIPPHNWFLCLDIDSYFDHEHNPELIPESGFLRPVSVGARDVALNVHFNGDPEQPEFHIRSEEKLSRKEMETANISLQRILGTELDLRPFYDKAANDPVLGNKLIELYGLKRMSRANLFQDMLNRIVEMRLSHKPTAKKMMYKLRERYAPSVLAEGKMLASWPQPSHLLSAEPSVIRSLGPTLRKGEYIVELAHNLMAGTPDLGSLEQADPEIFYDTVLGIKGIGPTAAQDLMLMRNTTQAIFPSNIQRGEEKGLRKWIIMSYGADPNHTTEAQFQKNDCNLEGI